MSHWNTLKITPTADKKAIKQAYARLLKLNKPDENPEGFAQLHKAYKHCLNEAPHVEAEVSHEGEVLEQVTAMAVEPTAQVPQDSEAPANIATVDMGTPSEPAQARDTEVISTALLEPEPEPAQQEPTQETEQRLNYLRHIWSILEDKTETVLNECENTPMTAKHWAFLESCEELYDIEFKEEFSYFLFGLLLTFFDEHKAQLKKSANGLRFLDKLFHWSENDQQLQQIYGYDRSDALLLALLDFDTQALWQGGSLQWRCSKVHQGLMQSANYYARMVALVIDMLLLFFVCTAAMGDDSTAGLATALIVYSFLVPILEASPLQGSIGKILLGMKVTDAKGKRLNIFHAFARQIVFMCSTAAFKLTVWINFFIYDGRLLHDKLSSSSVIKR